MPKWRLVAKLKGLLGATIEQYTESSFGLRIHHSHSYIACHIIKGKDHKAAVKAFEELMLVKKTRWQQC